MAADNAYGARADDSRRPRAAARWQTNVPGDTRIQGRTPTTTDYHVRRRPRVKAS